MPGAPRPYPRDRREGLYEDKGLLKNEGLYRNDGRFENAPIESERGFNDPGSGSGDRHDRILDQAPLGRERE